MVEIKIRREGSTRLLKMTGHADYAKDGQPDIICAACSALLYAFLGWLSNHPAEYEEEEPIRVCPGDVTVKLRVKGPFLDTALDSALEGFSQLARTAPDSVRLLQ